MRRLTVFMIAACFLCSIVIGGRFAVSADEMQPSEPVSASQRLTIEEAGVYTLTGSMKGTVYVDPGVGDVTLILDNADIQSANEPAIMAVSGDRLTIEVKDHTCNAISDSPDNTMGAVIYTEVDTTLEGCGCLQVNARSRCGIVSDNASLTFQCGTILIVSESSGIKADGADQGAVCFNGGNTYINAKHDDMIDAADIRMNGGKAASSDETSVCNLCGCCGGKTCFTRTVPVVMDLCGDPCSCCDPTTDEPGEIAAGITTNSAAALEPDLPGAVDIVLNDESGNILISQAGTYDITGKNSNGSITVAQGTKGVVLILNNLDLTSTEGAALMIGNDAEVRIEVEGKVVLKDACPDTGDAAGTGAAIQAEAGTAVCITGDGVLEVISDSSDGIQMGEDSSLVIDGDFKIDITAEKTGIWSEHDVAILSADLTISAGNAGVHADHILTVGDDEGNDLTVRITEWREGLDANVVNITDGYIEITAEEDGIDAENPDASDEPGTETPEASVNITGGELVIEAGGSAVDSDGNINLIGGSMTIDSEGACVDYIDDLYISDDFELDCKCDNSEAEVYVEQTVCIDTPACSDAPGCVNTPADPEDKAFQDAPVPDSAEDAAETGQAGGASDSDDDVDDGSEDDDPEDGEFENDESEDPDIEND
ncbi:MAG: carbohydrate-binding domain-containing protein [Parasporobacterium sp.]|nr:carbohydrate-binding domain-containing protein [Parasporobacterium sp.]